MNEVFSMHPIGWVQSVFKEKFGTPRQSGVVPSATGVLHFYPPYDQRTAFREIECFSHLWVLSIFHLIPEQSFRPLVRPPKLGGAKKVGVFASRAPYRPNRLCLSVVKLEEVLEVKGKVQLKVSGLDLVDQTPLLDVKPYLPYADALPAAYAGYGLSASAAQHRIREEKEGVLSALSPEEKCLIYETLQAQPEPAYATESQCFKMSLGHLHVAWKLQDGVTIIIEAYRTSNNS